MPSDGAFWLRGAAGWAMWSLLVALACSLCQAQESMTTTGLEKQAISSSALTSVPPEFKKIYRESSAPGFERAKTEEQMAPLIQENLDPDFAEWRGKTLSIASDLLGMSDLLYHAHIGVVIIKNNIVYIFRNTTAHGYTVQRMRLMQRHMMRAIRDNGVVFPDTVFFYNLVDFPPCLEIRGNGCTAPVFTVYKRWDYENNRNSVDTEIAFPHYGRTFGYLYNYPWEEKIPEALLRARIQTSMDEKSTRLVISERAASDPEAVGVLDAGIVDNRNTNIQVSKDAQKKYVWLKNHARWKFLINTNGHVCSSRLGQLFQMNSLVLNEKTDWIEYYYRSIHPGVHFVQLNVTGVVQQVKELQSPEKDAEVRWMVNNSQHFGYRYLGHLSKVIYTKAMLKRYNDLFPSMQAFMDSLELPKPRKDLSERRITKPSTKEDSYGVILEEDDYVATEDAMSMTMLHGILKEGIKRMTLVAL